MTETDQKSTDHLRKELETARAELAIINAVQEALASNLDMPGIYTLVGDTIGEITGAGVVLFASWDWETRTMRSEYFRDQGEQLGPVERPLSALHDEIFPELERGKTIVWNDGIEERYRQFGHVAAAGKIPKSTVAVPLKIGGKIDSSIILQDTEQEHAFGESTIQLLETLADSMSMALENAQLFDEVQTRNREISEALERETASNEILSVIAESPTDIQPVLDVIAQNAARLSGSEDAIIATKDGELLKVVSHYGDIPMIPVGEGIHFDQYSVAGRSMLECRPVQAIHNQPGADSEFPEGDKVAKKYGYRTSSSVPLMREGKAVGVITIRRKNPELLTETQIELIQSFANQAAIAVENVRLFEAEQQRIAELQIINSVQEGLASQLDMPGIYTLIGDTLSKITGAGVVLIANWDWETRTMRAEYFQDQGKQLGPIERPLSAMHDWAFPRLERGETIVANEGIEELYREAGHVVAAGQIPKTSVSVPLKIGGKINAFISLQDTEKEYAFSQSTVQLVETLAGSMGVALESVRLFDETQRLLKETAERNAELAVINSVQEALAAQLDLQAIYDLVGDKISEITGSEIVVINTW
ncbi:MAG TPA: GAF domain-containing protein, partial [Anaerolineales bacterium]|nr:GAF domain-containing protein [Anaerolineales bacterium]